MDDQGASTCLHYVCQATRGTLDYDTEDSDAENADEALDEEKERSMLVEDHEIETQGSFVAGRDLPEVAGVHKETHLRFSFGRMESEIDRLALLKATDLLADHEDDQDEDVAPSSMPIQTVQTLLKIGGKDLCMQQDKQGQTALHLCCFAGHVNRSIALFQCAGHELLTLKDNEGHTCTEIAEIELGRLKAVRAEARESEIEVKISRIAEIVRFLKDQGA